jgi:hypothetical protein
MGIFCITRSFGSSEMRCLLSYFKNAGSTEMRRTNGRIRKKKAETRSTLLLGLIQDKPDRQEHRKHKEQPDINREQKKAEKHLKKPSEKRAFERTYVKFTVHIPVILLRTGRQTDTGGTRKAAEVLKDAASQNARLLPEKKGPKFAGSPAAEKRPADKDKPVNAEHYGAEHTVNKLSCRCSFERTEIEISDPSFKSVSHDILPKEFTHSFILNFPEKPKGIFFKNVP